MPEKGANRAEIAPPYVHLIQMGTAYRHGPGSRSYGRHDRRGPNAAGSRCCMSVTVADTKPSTSRSMSVDRHTARTASKS